MSLILPINVEDLLYCQGVESARVEFKASWDPKTTGAQVLKTICAFANDLQNLNGGYIVIGVAEEDGRAIMPPKGLSREQIDEAQKWIRGNCNRLDPEYQPTMSPEIIADRLILVLWAPASDIRPHRAPEGDKAERKYYVRLGAETVDAERTGMLRQLIELNAKVPFDDRRALQATINDLRESKVREFLRDIRSGLVEEHSTRELYRKLKIASPVNGHDVPRNIGLLLFSEDPEIWFPGARIEVVQFADGAGGNLVEEKIFRGGLHEQLRRALSNLETISSTHLVKQDHSFKVKGWVSYPIPALREALVNAVYHKGYDSQEPVKVYLYPDRIEVISYPGPVQGIQLAHLKQESPMPPVPARNRVIGERLKELRLAEGRGTGLPKIFRSMRENGSQDPVFDFDEGRSYFRVILPAHPEFVAISALRDAAHLKAIGDDLGSFKRIESAWQALPSSPSLATEYLRMLGIRGRLTDAGIAFSTFKVHAPEQFHPYVANVFIELLVDAERNEEAKALLDQQPQYLTSADALDSAILARRLGNQEKAHRYFERAGDAVLYDAKGLHEFSQTKIALAKKLLHEHQGRASNKRLLLEAKELLERVVHMEADRVRHSWAWRDLARVKNWLKYPQGEVITAYRRAIELTPDERRFRDELAHFESRRSSSL